MAKDRSEIEVGDRVWVNDGYKRMRIQPVARLTKSWIILDGYYAGGASCAYNRFRRSDYYQVAGGMFSPSITAVATDEEFAQWQAEQEVKRQAEDAAHAERQRIEAIKLELGGLFAKNARVTHLDLQYADAPGEWEVTLVLNESGVRELAALLQAKTAAV